jgi:SOS-response transcriptional repressor LexA
MDDLKQWVLQAMRAKKLSMSDLSRQLGIPVDGISKFLKDKRGLTASEMREIERITGVVAPAINENLNETKLTSAAVARKLERIRVVGEVAGGVWKEMNHLDFPEYELDYPLNPRWPADAIKALRVVGESINRQARDGDHVVCLDMWSFPRDLKSGDWVVVHRQRGEIVETTVKKLVGEPGSWMLHPDSTDPRFQEPIPMNGADGIGDEVRVVAVVLDFIRPATII